MSEQLNLSEEEKRELDEVFIESRRKLIGLISSVDIEQFELQNLFEIKTLYEAAVMEQFERLENARTSLGAKHFNLLLEIRKIIGFERFQRLKLFHQKIRQERIRRWRDDPDLKKTTPI